MWAKISLWGVEWCGMTAGEPAAVARFDRDGTCAKSSRVEPRVAFLKPLSTAISIGSGGPFGAEGPIIMTGGAFGSMIAQCMRLTSAERKTLLVAGAAGGCRRPLLRQ